MRHSDGIRLSIEGPIARIRIDRQRRRNALGLQDWQDLAQNLREADSFPDVRAIVLSGAGSHFGAGNDIAELAGLRGRPSVARAFGTAMSEGIAAIAAARVPVIAAIEGQCYGASVALALAADIRVASASASFAITPARLGALYLQSDLHRLVAAVGQGQARRLIYSAEPIDAGQALKIGLVDELAAPDQFEAGVERLASAIARGSPFTLGETKAMLARAGFGRPSPETPATLEIFVTATQGCDFAEGVEAFLERRPPRFA